MVGFKMQRYIKNRDFLRPVYKKVKTMTIFVGKRGLWVYHCLT